MFYRTFVVAAVALAFAGFVMIMSGCSTALASTNTDASAKSKYTITLTPEEAQVCEEEGGCAYVSAEAVHRMLLAEVQAYFNSGGPNFTCTKNTAEVPS